MEDQDLDKYGFIDTSGQLIELASTFTTQATTGSISDSYLSTLSTLLMALVMVIIVVLTTIK